MKKRAALILGLLLVTFVLVNVFVNPAMGFFVGGSSPENLSTWINIGYQVGVALATAFGNEIYILIAMVLFLA